MKKLNYFGLLFLVFMGTKIAVAQPIPVDTTLLTGKLNNGLTYYIRHNERTKGAANFYIVQKVGSILERDDQRGLAHFLEHEAFNGTKHFPGTTVVKEMEKKGVRFGSHINAQTSFDETVYNLNGVPTTREGIVDTALLILHDWSGEITNLQPDIEEERGIIREEWRTRSSASLRMDEKVILPTLLAGTPYANRIPIGSMDVVNNFKRQELVDYYKKWYRPDLQGIIIVGDVDPNKILEKLNTLFEDIPAPVNPAKREYVKIPDNDAPIVAIATDPEYPVANAEVYWKGDDVPADQRNTRRYFKMQIVNELISNMLDERIEKLKQKKGATFVNAYSKMGQYSISQRPAWLADIAPANYNVLGALKDVLTECERMRRFGFSKNEFEHDIKHFYSSRNETDYKDKEVVRNEEYIIRYINNFLYNEPAPDAAWKYFTTKEILDNMTIDTLNFYAKKYIHDNNMAFEIDLPDKNGIAVPTKEEVLAVWDEVKNSKLKPYVKKEEPDVVAKLKTPEPAAITNAEENTAPFGYAKWKFSNGVEVWFKHTDVNESTVWINGYKPGGYSLLKRKDLPTAAAYDGLAQLAGGFNGFNGKIQGQTNLTRTKASITTKASSTDLKLQFQYVYVNMTQIKKKTSVFNNWETGHLQALRKRVISSSTIFRDTLNAIILNRSPWALTLADSNELKQVNYREVSRIHKQFFGNAAGFTFIITGNVNADTVRALAQTWLGGLPSTGLPAQVIDHNVYPPPGIIKKHLVEKMATPKTTVGIIYSGEIPVTMQNIALMQMTTEMLNTRYLATIREKEGASYGVSVQGQVYKYPKDRYYVQISFDTDPDSVKKEKMIGIIYGEIKKLMADAPDKDMVEKARTDFLTSYQQGKKLKNSDYWSGIAVYYYENGLDYDHEYGEVLKSVTPEQIRDFAKNVFSQGNLIEMKMDPAK
jgi:zinc protease